MEYRGHEPVPPQEMQGIVEKFKKKLAKKDSDE
jgi:hypothetical protein